MSIRVKCPVCGYRIKAPDGAYGRRGQCPRCKLMIRLPKEAELDSLGTHSEVVSIEPVVENLQDLSRITPPTSSESGEVTMSSDSSMELELGSPQE